MRGVSVLFARVRYSCKTLAAVVRAADDQATMCMLGTRMLVVFCMSVMCVVEPRSMHACDTCIPWCCYAC